MSMKRVLTTVHLTSLGLWLGTLVMTGASAAIIFPMVKALDPVIPSYSGYTGEHWRIVAGQPANTFFFVSGIIQFVCCLLAMGSMLGLILLMRSDWRRLFVAFRLTVLTAAMCIFGYFFTVQTPAMNREAVAFWTAAHAGDNAVAEQHQQAFQAMHPTSTRLMGTTTILVLLVLVTGAWSVTDPTVHEPGELEEPRLARGGS